ncbi:MAG: N-acetyl-gamma-glutamyl-phosphate reductase [Acidobacteria bacterium RIFCSPLOWO2_12_FULL_67_14b]|nr:MAG: N-acetyl-gamma-glutamyl-phosphate reductase [Acidobacteria bacterium RIFCSPLOWO2_12_FULL_67_14b]
MDTQVVTETEGDQRGRHRLIRVAVAGATGFAGQELIRLLSRHPHATITAATGSQATSTPRSLPALARIWDGTVVPLDPAALVGKADAVFLGLPEAASAEIAPVLLDAGLRVIDLSGAFRLRDEAARARWYPATKALPAGVAYGLTEFELEAIRPARLLSNPGCYPTASLLGLLPLQRAGLLQPGADIVIDAKSGISGAGKAPTERTHFSENHGSVAAYNPFGHRHTPEMEQALGRGVTFVPHLVPLDRGILASLYARLVPGTPAAAVTAAFERDYAHAPFVRLTGDLLPEIKHVAHTNFCDIGWKVDEAGSRVFVVSVIDNLVKGAAGQAIQNFNVMFGLDQKAGLL